MIECTDENAIKQRCFAENVAAVVVDGNRDNVYSTAITFELDIRFPAKQEDSLYACTEPGAQAVSYSKCDKGHFPVDKTT